MPINLFLLLLCSLSLLSCSSTATTTEVPSSDTLQLIWSDEFNYSGAPDPNKWSYVTGALGFNEDLQYYTRDENAYVSEGTLKIVAKAESKDSCNYTSALLSTRDLADFTYGRIEVRAKLPSAEGTHPAIWMRPTHKKYGDSDFKSGEIDIMEAIGNDPHAIYSAVHTEEYNLYKGNTQGSCLRDINSSDSFHIYAINWYEDSIQFQVDTITHFTFHKEADTSSYWPFDIPFFLYLNIAIGGKWAGEDGIAAAAKFPQIMEVDYVRAYAFPTKETQHTLTSSSTNGDIIPSPKNNFYASGESITVTAVADSGYEFRSWQGDLYGRENPCITKINRDLTISADFQRVGEILKNTTFKYNKRDWTFYTDTTATATLTTKDNALITISDSGEKSWSIGLYQRDFVIEKDETYRLSITASASENRTLEIGVQEHGGDYKYYLSKKITLTTERETFTVEGSINATPHDPRVSFNIGATEGDITIYEINLQKIK